MTKELEDVLRDGVRRTVASPWAWSPITGPRSSTSNAIPSRRPSVRTAEERPSEWAGRLLLRPPPMSMTQTCCPSVRRSAEGARELDSVPAAARPGELQPGAVLQQVKNMKTTSHAANKPCCRGRSAMDADNCKIKRRRWLLLLSWSVAAGIGAASLPQRGSPPCILQKHMSAIGTKRHPASALHMSAFDPKRT